MVVVAAGMAMSACTSPPTGPGNQANVNQSVAIFDPANPGADYQAVNDPGQQGVLMQQMWTALTAPACWDASAVVPVGHVSQFQFYGQYEYRHFGYSTNFGGIFLHSIGHYKGRAAAVLETWTGVLEALVVVDGSTIAHAFPNVENTALVVTQYGASNGPCL
jgi:hypothetical protein